MSSYSSTKRAKFNHLKKYLDNKISCMLNQTQTEKVYMKYVFLLGRVLFASIFILKSLDHFSLETVQQAASKGVPVPSVLVPLSGLVAFLGGLSILLGYKARKGAWFLVLFLLPTAFMMHKFWEVSDLHTMLLQQYCFMKNIALLGAALMISHLGSGPLSLSRD